MKRIVNWRFVACVTVLAFVCLALENFVSNNLLADMCGNTVIREVLSPEKGHKAVIFQRNCGATTGYSTQVSVLPARKILPNEGGNIFVVDEGDGDITVHWINLTQLKIIYDHRARIFNKQTQYYLVSIVYEAR